MASGLRVLRGCAGRCVWDEWAATGDLWVDAALVCTALSSNVAGIFSAGEHYRHEWVLGSRAVGSCCDALLSTVFASITAVDMAG